MFCNNCGSKIEETDKFCGTCGAPNTRAVVNDDPFAQPPGAGTPKTDSGLQQQSLRPAQNSQQQNSFSQQGGDSSENSYALVGFILSFFIPILGLIFSILGLKEANRTNGSRKGFAIAGIAISIVEMVLAFIIILITVATVVSAASRLPYYYYYDAVIALM